MRKMITLGGALLLAGVLAAGAAVAADSPPGNWSGALAPTPSAEPVYDDATGWASINYRTGRGDWVSEVSGSGLVPEQNYQALLITKHPGGQHISLGCFAADVDGEGVVEAFHPTVPDLSDESARVNIRLQNTGVAGCAGHSNSGKLSTVFADGLTFSGGNRPAGPPGRS